jgi:hypothetical protein
MMLSDDDVNEFKQLYEEEFKEAISEGDAQIMASQLIQLYDALAEPLPGEFPDELARTLDTAILES